MEFTAPSARTKHAHQPLWSRQLSSESKLGNMKKNTGIH